MAGRERAASCKTFSVEPLESYRGNLFYNVNYLAVAFLYDFPRIAGRPRELYSIIERWEAGRASERDRLVIEVLKSRLSEFKETKEVAESL